MVRNHLQESRSKVARSKLTEYFTGSELTEMKRSSAESVRVGPGKDTNKERGTHEAGELRGMMGGSEGGGRMGEGEIVARIKRGEKERGGK